MKIIERSVIAVTALLLAGTTVAQTTTTTTRTDEGASSYAVSRMTGEVVVVDVLQLHQTCAGTPLRSRSNIR